MPTSKRSARRRSRFEKRTSRSAPVSRARSHHLIRGNKWIVVPMIVVGLVLFLMGNIGARTGIVILPFDPHHVYEQLGGALVSGR
jgi:hypothetical protein